ncbi:MULTISPECIES: hypothetical protein [unclassified Pseudomonas]|uniref:hypothetical protein n=1 Tax=unclassified Pseudomonas TaxID=196821 RepID=UPI0010675FF9|nr:hypothetical protein [Pseudomonas sp. SXM-1]QBQ11160.1 hypothetical protein DCC84_16130 [Pseudomonas sp. SXM-1]
MNWILGGVALLLCIVTGLLGLTAGINLNPESTVRFVPAWGSLGDWISGIGALLAVVTSLYLVRRNEALQHEREREKIEVEQWAENFFCSIRVISLGIFPCTVKSVFLLGPDDGAVPLNPYLPEENRLQLPVRLEIREDIHFVWRVDQLRDLLGRISLFRLQNVEALRIQVTTVTSEIIVPISPEIAAYLMSVSISSGVPIAFDD